MNSTQDVLEKRGGSPGSGKLPDFAVASVRQPSLMPLNITRAGDRYLWQLRPSTVNVSNLLQHTLPKPYGCHHFCGPGQSDTSRKFIPGECKYSLKPLGN